MNIHKVIEGLKKIDAKIGTGQLTEWRSDNVYHELRETGKGVVVNNSYTYTHRKTKFDPNTILGNILSLVSSLDSSEFEKWRRSNFDMSHRFKCDVEVESDKYSEKAEYLGVEQELSVKMSHTVDEYHTLLDLVISSKCDNLKKILLENRLPSILAFERQVLGAHGAGNRSVLNIHEDLSTGATTQLPTEVEFRKKSNGAKVSPDPKYIGYMIVSGVFTVFATVAMACDQSKLTIIAGTFVAAASFACLCYSAYQYINPSIAKAEKGPLNSLDNLEASRGVATQI